MSGELVTTAQAAQLLGVRTTTVYSYVSRGILHRVGGDSRHDGSHFDRREVLAVRDQRLRQRSGLFEVSIDTAITRVDPAGELSYRGHDVADLSRRITYERCAELLWETEELSWDATPEALVAGGSAKDLDPEPSPAARARCAVSTLAALRECDDTPFAAAAVMALNAAVIALGDQPDGGTIATRVAHALGAGDRAAVAPIINSALILLADHELATSTVAARVSASTGAAPLDVITTGLYSMPGHRHAGVSVEAARMLRRCTQVGVRDAVAELSPVPGFGHIIYQAPDPRAVVLLDLLTPLAPNLTALVDDLCLEVLRVHGIHPNVDIALAALEVGLQLPPRTGEALFTIARIAGFAAHGLEEQGLPLRFRARATYVGP